MQLAKDGIGTAIADQRPQIVIIETETVIVIETDAAQVIEIGIDLMTKARVRTDVNIPHCLSCANALTRRSQMLTATVKRLNRTNALTRSRRRRRRRSQVLTVTVTRQTMTDLNKIQFVVGTGRQYMSLI